MTDRAISSTSAEPDADDMASVRWYVAKTHTNAEEKALFHLQRQGFDVYLPRYLRRVSHARRISWQPRPLFPTYLFVTMGGPDQRWRAINSTIGVAHLICDECGPLPVPTGAVETIRHQEDERGHVITGQNMVYKKGIKVQVISGAFSDQIGLFECATDDERAIILLNIMGRQVKSRVKIDAITSVV